MGGKLTSKINFIQDSGLSIACEIHTCAVHLDANFKILFTFVELVLNMFFISWLLGCCPLNCTHVFNYEMAIAK